MQLAESPGWLSWPGGDVVADIVEGNGRKMGEGAPRMNGGASRAAF
jgi:hypothetical protein